jgi:hypothetical protein
MLDIEFQSLSGNNLCIGLDIATFDYTKRPTHYSLPEVETDTLQRHMQTQINTRYYRPREVQARYENTPAVIDSFIPFFAIGTHCTVSRGNLQPERPT